MSKAHGVLNGESIRVEVDAGVAFLRIDRPEKRNALDEAARAELIAAVDRAGRDPDVRVVVITGTGDESFAAGADLSDSQPGSVLEQRAAMEERRIYDAVSECPKPVVAMINGHCLGGGCELALAADIRIASARAKLGQPEIRLAMLPGGGGTQRLPRLIGLGQALRLVLTGAAVDADEALRLGLVELVVPHDELELRTRELCAAMARHSPVALALAKQAVRASQELPLREGLRAERELFCLAFSSADREEGVAAFLEKRKPRFAGR